MLPLTSNFFCRKLSSLIERKEAKAMNPNQDITKSQERGISLLNSLFKIGILYFIIVAISFPVAVLSMIYSDSGDFFLAYVFFPFLPIIIICFFVGLSLAEGCDKKAIKQGIIGFCISIAAYPVVASLTSLVMNLLSYGKYHI